MRKAVYSWCLFCCLSEKNWVAALAGLVRLKHEKCQFHFSRSRFWSMLFFFLYLYWQMETTTFFFLWNYLCLCRINGREETRSPSVYEWVSAIRFGFTWCFEQIVKFNLKNTQAYTHSSMSKSTLRKFLWLFLNTVDKVLKVDIFSFICVSLSLSHPFPSDVCMCNVESRPFPLRCVEGMRRWRRSGIYLLMQRMYGRT